MEGDGDGETHGGQDVEGLVAAGGREGDVELLVACTKVDAGALQGLVIASVAKAQTYMDAAPSQFLMNPTTVPSAVLACRRPVYLRQVSLSLG